MMTPSGMLVTGFVAKVMVTLRDVSSGSPDVARVVFYNVSNGVLYRKLFSALRCAWSSPSELKARDTIVCAGSSITCSTPIPTFPEYSENVTSTRAESASAAPWAASFTTMEWRLLPRQRPFDSWTDLPSPGTVDFVHLKYYYLVVFGGENISTIWT